MGIPCDDVVQIRPPEVAGEPTVITINCPDKIGLGCDLCRVILFFGLSILRGDASTDGKWCYVVFWVEGRGGKSTRWGLLKKRLLEACPTAPAASGLCSYHYWSPEVTAPEQKPQVFLLKCCCYDRNGLLHDMTQVLSELELTILKVKVSTTPDGRVINLFFVTDTRFSSFHFIERFTWYHIKHICVCIYVCIQYRFREFIHTRKRKDETFDHLKSVLGDSITCFEIEPTTGAINASLQPSHFLPPEISEEMFNIELPEEEERFEGSVSIDNSLSPGHSLIQIVCRDRKGLLYDVMRSLKDHNIQLSYGRFYSTKNGKCEFDLFVVQADGKKVLDNCKQKALCDRLRMEMYKPVRVTVVSRGPDRELFVANPVELSGKGRPLVFHDVTLALKSLHTRIFLAEIGRHVVSNREWEVYRFLLEDDESSTGRNKMVEEVTKMLMGWE